MSDKEKNPCSKRRGYVALACAFLIGFGLWMSGVMIYKGFNSLADKSRTVSVKGLAVREVDADEVIWPIVTKFGANDLGEISATVEKNNAAILAWLKQNGISESEISVSAPEVVNNQTNSYSNFQEPFVYNVTNVITVTSKEVKKVNAIMRNQGSLLAEGVAIAGGGWEYKPTYNFNGLNDIKPSMIEESTKAARAAAEKFASDSESKLGNIFSASQGQFEITDRDQYTPWIKQVRVVCYVNYTLDD